MLSKKIALSVILFTLALAIIPSAWSQEEGSGAMAVIMIPGVRYNDIQPGDEDKQSFECVSEAHPQDPRGTLMNCEKGKYYIIMSEVLERGEKYTCARTGTYIPVPFQEGEERLEEMFCFQAPVPLPELPTPPSDEPITPSPTPKKPAEKPAA